MKVFSYVFLIFIGLIACKSDQSKEQNLFGDIKPLSVEIFKMVAQPDGNYVMGEKTFHEKYIYDAKNVKKEHHILDQNGKVKAKEKYVYADKKLIGSNYMTASDSLLSYYAVVLDSVGNVQTKKSFDGSNKELLRVEAYEYDDQKLMKTKSIYDANMNNIRNFSFEYDEFGNEKAYKVYDPTGINIFGEEYKITKRDSLNRWVEKTGFRAQKPVTFKRRTIKD